jgi:hypothetical protein
MKLILVGAILSHLSCVSHSWTPASKILSSNHHHHHYNSFNVNVNGKQFSRFSTALYVKERQRDDLPSTGTNSISTLKSVVENNIDEENGNLKAFETTLDSSSNNESNNNNNNNNIQDILKEKLFLGIDPTPEILAIMSIYFVEGALGLARLAQTFYLKDTLHLGPAELSALTGLFTLPWTIKPIYGFLSDGLPLFGYRRRSYLIVCGLLGALSYTALGSNFFGFFNDGGLLDGIGSISMIQATIASFVISSGCIAFSDVVADGIVVQRTRDSDDPKVAGTWTK